MPTKSATKYSDFPEEIPGIKHTRRKHREDSTMNTTIAQVHKSAPARVHASGRRSQSRHERHKCHKHKQRLEDLELINQVAQLKNENHLLNRRLNASLSSIDSGLPNNENLPPLEIDIKKAYQHLKQDNSQLMTDIKNMRVECEEMKQITEQGLVENVCLKEDVCMLQNLVYRLNIELEKYQDIRDKIDNEEKPKKNYELPKYYHKNFLKPILPLLKAYSETIIEKNETIELAERNLEKFNMSFNELLKENETLYRELETKLTQGDGNIFDEIKLLRNDLNTTREERDLFRNQANLEKDKLKEVQTAYQAKVTRLENEKQVALDTAHEARADVYILRGKQSVLKQELERLRFQDDSKVPLIAHNASISECKRLFQSLKDEHDFEKQQLLQKVKELETKLIGKEVEIKKDLEEKLTLEQGNFDLAFECDSLKRRIKDLEKVEIVDTQQDQKDCEEIISSEESKKIKKQLREALKKNSDLEGKLSRTKKRLQQSMVFAEDLVREQETLLAQLHAKQKENSIMVTQFGSLKKKLKNVEKDAQAGLDSVEDKIKNQEMENLHLTKEVERLTRLLKEKVLLEETEDTTS